jgi:hypothetical protein
MRHVMLVVVVGVVAALCFAAAPVVAAPPTRAQFNALKNKVNRLQARVVAIEVCSQIVVPVARYGGFGNEGYLYGTVSGTTFTGGVVPALDIVDDLTGQVPGQDFEWFQIVDPACVEATTGRVATLAARPAPDVSSRLSFRIAARAS